MKDLQIPLRQLADRNDKGETMANTRELRRRIKSVKNTSQITKAMQMVAATKMRKAQTQALSGRPYLQALNFSVSNLLEAVNIEAHPLLQGNGSEKGAVLVLTTDKSLCGALNTNVFRVLQSLSKDLKNSLYYTVGKKGRQFVVKTDKALQADFENHEVITFRQARQIGKLLIDAYLNNEFGTLYLIYPHFVTTLRQETKQVSLLPIDPTHLKELLEDYLPANGKNGQNAEFLFEPDADELLEYILIHSIETKIYQALLETKASEHSARMIAMQNATDNAKELVADLQLAYNQTRQDSITKELLEITTASAAME